MKLYQSTLARVLEALDDSPKDLELRESEMDTEEKQKVWPPWPWPPWGDDDKGDHNEPGKHPLNKTERARELAKNVVKFEKRIANASLDL